MKILVATALSSCVLVAIAPRSIVAFSSSYPVVVSRAARRRGTIFVGIAIPPPSLRAEIRPATEKSEVLEYGWDGTTALGKAVVDSKPARLLDQIRASGETQSDACQLFNANLEMSGDTLMFDEFITLCDEQYEYGLIEFKNGDMINGPGENDGSAKVLSYAALANFDKDTTLKYGWEGVDFSNGIALTKKAVGESDWDWDSESWIP
ncbi:hypothetical protein ACHAXA_010404 [Cyclostephanos tholiformis]|uniref:Uncharacterized protein n=1 Tax=Cyclostephanos tholiformis TaxID=382380 RepID=A0ABD3SF62_9STRA